MYHFSFHFIFSYLLQGEMCCGYGADGKKIATAGKNELNNSLKFEKEQPMAKKNPVKFGFFCSKNAHFGGILILK